MTFGSAGDYIAADKPDVPASLILDVELPDINGLDQQNQIAQGDHPPIVFITGHGDIPLSVRAIRHGAVDFLTKPFSDDDLMRAIDTALAQDLLARGERADLAEIQQRYDELTPREREVLPLVVSGLLNKQAASELGISEVRSRSIAETSCTRGRPRPSPTSCAWRTVCTYQSLIRAVERAEREREGP